jgi:hypothetical protein
VTFYPVYDGTFTTEAVATAGLALLDRLHAEALATIAEIADTWDRPEPRDVTQQDEPTSWSDPETWSVEDDEDLLDDELEELDDAPVRLLALPPLPTARTGRPAVGRELVLHR